MKRQIRRNVWSSFISAYTHCERWWCDTIGISRTNRLWLSRVWSNRCWSETNSDRWRKMANFWPTFDRTLHVYAHTCGVARTVYVLSIANVFHADRSVRVLYACSACVRVCVCVCEHNNNNNIIVDCTCMPYKCIGTINNIITYDTINIFTCVSIGWSSNSTSTSTSTTSNYNNSSSTNDNDNEQRRTAIAIGAAAAAAVVTTM